jgi:hypothetical protein
VTLARAPFACKLIAICVGWLGRSKCPPSALLKSIPLSRGTLCDIFYIHHVVPEHTQHKCSRYLPMKLCQNTTNKDLPHFAGRPRRLWNLIAPTTVHANLKGLLRTEMADSFRRAGIRLKAVIAMNRRSHYGNPPSEEQKNSSRRCHLLELPTELLLEIISYLSVLSEACLALTCKRLFAISGAVLDAKPLRFNRDFAPLFHHYRNGHSFATTRWQLVKILEDSRWRACSKCLKLHPRSFFPPRELRRKSDDRTCNLGSLAGVVDLCPCKKITFRDKIELVELLKIRKKSVAILASQFGSAVQERFCWHSCTENYGFTQMKIEIYPELDGDNQLRIRTEYHMTTTPGRLGKEDYMTARFGCAHRSVDLWLSGVCQTAICQLYENRCVSCRRIAICNSCNAVLRCPRRQPSRIDEESGTATYSFWTERCLGGASPTPDLPWAAQRIHPAEALVDLDNCSELCPWTIREHPPLLNPPSLDMDILDPAIQDQSLNQLYTSIHTT